MLPSVLGLYDGQDNGCSFYRLISPYFQLNSYGYRFNWVQTSPPDKKTLKEEEFVQTPAGFHVPKEITGKHYNVVSLLRPLIAYHDENNTPIKDMEFTRELIENAHRNGAIFGGDLDDDMWSVADSNPAKKIIGEETPELIAETLRHLDFVTCSTAFLRQRVIDIAGVEPERVYVVPNLVDFDLFDRDAWILPTGEFTEYSTGRGKKKKSHKKEVTKTLSMRDVRRRRLGEADDRPLVIGLQGGPSHYDDWKIIAPVLSKIAARHGSRIRIMVCGSHFDYMKEALYWANEEKLVYWKEWQPFERHSESVAAFDINLCPLEDTLFNQSKSAIKWMEGSAAGAASIVSPTVYRQFVKPGQTAVVAHTAKDWEDALNALIENRTLRQNIARSAHTEVRIHHNLEDKCHIWLNTYAQALEQNYDRVRLLIMKKHEDDLNEEMEQLLAPASAA